MSHSLRNDSKITFIPKFDSAFEWSNSIYMPDIGASRNPSNDSQDCSLWEYRISLQSRRIPALQVHCRERTRLLGLCVHLTSSDNLRFTLARRAKLIHFPQTGFFGLGNHEQIVTLNKSALPGLTIRLPDPSNFCNIHFSDIQQHRYYTSLMTRRWKLIAISLALSARADPNPPEMKSECLSPGPDTCNFYATCLEPIYHCGPDGYPLGYGQYFCQKFKNETSRFTTHGGQWLSKTMLCLQRVLIPEATSPITASGGVRTCEQLKDAALSKHAKCYVECGLCQLSPVDWWVVVSTVGIRSMFSSFEGIGQVVEAAGLCVGYFSLVAVGLAVLGGSAYLGVHIFA